MRWQPVADLAVDPQSCLIYAEGWQSWSPSGTALLTEPVLRPTTGNVIALGYRADQPTSEYRQGEGLLAVASDSAVHVFAWAPSTLPSIRVIPDGTVARIEATGAVQHTMHGEDLHAALAKWAEGFAAEDGVGELRCAPTVWCSWYHYFAEVSADDIAENLDAMADLDLPIEVVQLDDGYERQIGDWLALSDRFASLADAGRIRSHGRRAGIWVAPSWWGSARPSLHGTRTWLVPGIDAGRNWDQALRVLDVTHPGAAAYVTEVFRALRATGFDYFKIDFCYAGALEGRRFEPLPGLDAYRLGLGLIRAAIGDAYLVGCGAPTLGSVGLVDAMRVGPDTATHVEPTEGDPSQPGQRFAIANGVVRAWQHGRFWVNDSDCLIARPQVQQREAWAAHVERYGGPRPPATAYQTSMSGASPRRAGCWPQGLHRRRSDAASRSFSSMVNAPIRACLIRLQIDLAHPYGRHVAGRGFRACRPAVSPRRSGLPRKGKEGSREPRDPSFAEWIRMRSGTR